jgi:membrane protease YdiL (CAAX protease family)
MAEVQKKNGWTTTMRWAARLIGLAAAGLFVAFLAVSGSFVLSEIDWASPQGLPLALALVVAVAGVLVAWRWELVGGLMAMVGSVAIMGLVCAGSGADMLYCAFLFTLPMLLAGALYLGCCARKRVTQEA